jgi:hypothetical protein
MTSPKIKRVTVLQVVALAGVALALPLASQAAPGQNSTPGKPLVATAGATRVDPPSAVLEGSIDPRTLATTYVFEYGPTAAYGSRTATATLAGGTAKVRVSQAVTGIQLGYHYRLVASNADGTRDGRDRTIGSSQKAAFVLPKTFQATPLGSAFILSGTLTGTGNANRSIVLQASPYPYRTAFADVGAPIATNAAGRFSFRVAKLTTSTRFRVATVGAKPLYSPVVPELVTVRVLLKVRSSSSAPGLVRLYGTVTPAEAGAHIFVQLEKPPKTKGEAEKPPRSETLIKPEKSKKSGKSNKSEKAENSEKPPTYLTQFTGVVKRGTRALSRFSMIVKIQTAGNYRVFVVVRPGALASGHSQTIYLHAAPGSKRKHSGKKKK